MTTPEEISLSSIPHERIVLWSNPDHIRAIPELSGIPSVHDLSLIPPGSQTLLVAGGGERIDKAKVFRAQRAPQLRLIALPTLWGSGAEVSPIVILNSASGKEIRMGEEFLPDAVVYANHLARDIPAPLRSAGIGDALSHAFEALLSPLASDSVRQDAGSVLRQMLNQQDTAHPSWFSLSARACRAQSQSGVGLIHGIAHTLEPLGAHGAFAPGHAGLCALFLLPVFEFTLASSSKASSILEALQIPISLFRSRTSAFFDPVAYARILLLLQENWRAILRDRCTRMNSILVRPASLDFFTHFRVPTA